MLEIQNVTLLAMDCVDPIRTVYAMQYSMLQAKFARAVLITSRATFDPRMLDHIGGKGRLEIEAHFVQQGGREDYEKAIICDLHNHFDTEHCLFMEHDSGIINPSLWKPEWLSFDFIGATWPYSFHERGYPPCTRNNCVGNGGFSLRSRAFCVATSNRYDNSPEAKRLSDAWISRTKRADLESRGMRFAPPEEADRFCQENRIIAGQCFGFHGKNTIKMNGWNWNFDWMI